MKCFHVEGEMETDDVAVPDTLFTSCTFSYIVKVLCISSGFVFVIGEDFYRKPCQLTGQPRTGMSKANDTHFSSFQFDPSVFFPIPMKIFNFFIGTKKMRSEEHTSELQSRGH